KLERIPGLFAAADSFKVSAGHRLLIWSFTGEHIAERPLLGWGLDSSRAIPGGNSEIRPGQNWLSLHPHDAALQVWLELGMPGAVLVALLLGWFWLRLDRLAAPRLYVRSEEHTSELQSRENLVCRLLLEKKKKKTIESRYSM